MTNEPKDRKSILLPAKLLKDFKVKCAQKDKTMVEVLTEMIEKFLSKN